MDIWRFLPLPLSLQREVSGYLDLNPTPPTTHTKKKDKKKKKDPPKKKQEKKKKAFFNFLTSGHTWTQWDVLTYLCH